MGAQHHLKLELAPPTPNPIYSLLRSIHVSSWFTQEESHSGGKAVEIYTTWYCHTAVLTNITVLSDNYMILVVVTIIWQSVRNCAVTAVA